MWKSESDLRSRLHDPDYWLGPPPALGDRVRDAIGTAFLLLIVVPIILGAFVILGFMLVGTSVPGWVLLIWLLFFFGRSSTEAGPDDDR